MHITDAQLLYEMEEQLDDILQSPTTSQSPEQLSNKQLNSDPSMNMSMIPVTTTIQCCLFLYALLVSKGERFARHGTYNIHGYTIKKLVIVYSAFTVT